MAAIAAAGFLLAGLGIAGTASPALAAPGDTQLCSPNTNGGTLVNGVCELGTISLGQKAELFLLNTGGVDVWTIVSGSIPPGMTMPSIYGSTATIVAGTPTSQGTFTFTVDNVPFTSPGAPPPSQGTYSITVGPPLPLAVALPVRGSALLPGTVGTAYADDFALSGGLAPYTWSVAAGHLPPGLALKSPGAPSDNNSQLAGTPAAAGTFTFTMKVTDALGDQATQQFSLTVSR
jgi:hypothetical protein